MTVLEEELKRAVDVALSSAMLLMALPILGLIAIWIRLDGPGPILFVQTRVGRGGRPFPCYKFRTMVPNAERIGAGINIDANDARITRSGRFLRRFSLDELPQLWNVLRGDMSIVGPRPTLQYQVDQYTQFERRRLEVKPGLTGLAVVKGRNRLTWEQKIAYDVWYVDHYSIGLDLWIILVTPLVALKSEGVYGEGWHREAK